MHIHDPGHAYAIGGGQTLLFVKRLDGFQIHDGTTNEELLEVLINRLVTLNVPPLACEENAHAILALREALAMLTHRTRRRQAAGVEGSAFEPHPTFFSSRDAGDTAPSESETGPTGGQPDGERHDEEGQRQEAAEAGQGLLNPPTQ